MKVAIVHYWFVTRRGGEKVIESLLKLFPQADIYTLFYDPERYGDHLKSHKVYTSSLNKPFLIPHYQKLFPFYPQGIRSLKLKDDYDLIISSESGPAKGIQKPAHTPHICYIHSPMRYCWGFMDDYLASMPAPARPVAKYFFQQLRKWDQTTIDNVDLYIANSHNVADRVQRYYHREAEVIHPPIELSLYENNLDRSGEKAHYLSFGAITPYKRIDLLVDVFNANGKKLAIIGDGSEKAKLEKKAKSNITFYGVLEWSKIQALFAQSKALLFPGEEDFGMIPLEVMAYGIPVIAYRKGGALETVVENTADVAQSTGLFFDSQSEASLLQAIERFEQYEPRFDPEFIKAHSRKFGEDIFLARFKKLLKERMGITLDNA